MNRVFLILLIIVFLISGCTDSDYNGDSDNDGAGDIYGCTDPNATNYNSNATVDDGSCEYPSPAHLVLQNLSATTGSGYGFTSQYARITGTIKNKGDLPSSDNATFRPCMKWEVCGTGLIYSTQTYNFSQYYVQSIGGNQSISIQTDWEQITSSPAYPCSMIPSCSSISGY